MTVQVYDRKTLHFDALLGEASLPCSMLLDRMPRYAWVPLLSRTVAVGEIRLRLHWRELDIDDGGAEQQKTAFVVSFHGIGTSFVSDQVEVSHATLENIRLELGWRAAEFRAEFSIGMCQIDNQLASSTQPVVLAVPDTPDDDPVDAGNGDSGVSRPILHVSALRVIEKDNRIFHFRYFTVLLQEVDLHLEEAFLDALIDLTRTLVEEARGIDPTANDSPQTFLGRALLVPSDPAPVTRALGSPAWRYYFELLLLHPVKVNVTMTVLPGFKQVGTPGALIQRFTTAAGVTLIDINRVPLRLGALVVKTAFLSNDALYNQVCSRQARARGRVLYHLS